MICVEDGGGKPVTNQCVRVEDLVGRDDLALAALDLGDEDIGLERGIRVGKTQDLAAEPAGGCLRVDGSRCGQVAGENHLDLALLRNCAAGIGIDFGFALGPFGSAGSLADVVKAILELDIAVRHVREVSLGIRDRGHTSPAPVIGPDFGDRIAVCGGRDRRNDGRRGDRHGGSGRAGLSQLSAAGKGSDAAQE